MRSALLVTLALSFATPAFAAAPQSEMQHDMQGMADNLNNPATQKAMSGALGGMISALLGMRIDGLMKAMEPLNGGTFALYAMRYTGREWVGVLDALSLNECLDAIRGHPGELVGAACLIDRSGGTVDIGAPLVALARVNAPSYPADRLPPDLAALPAVKPGSPLTRAFGLVRADI